MNRISVLSAIALLSSCELFNPSIPADVLPDPPAFSLWSGAYIGAQQVVIAAAPDAVIFYTLDGSDPSQPNAIAYTAPIHIDEAKTLRAIAETEGRVSAVSTAQFLIFLWQGSLAAPPASPKVGWAYYDTLWGQSRFWDGTNWQVLAQDGMVGATGLTGATGAAGPTGPPGSDGTNGLNGAGIAWKGEFAESPVNPQLNWSYHDTNEGVSYIFDGAAWKILAVDGLVGPQGPTGATGATGSTGPAGANGAGIVWKGSFASPPPNPEANWAYYDSAGKKAFLYDGAGWRTIAQDGASGTDGATGATGSAGSDGTDGQDGVSIAWKGSFSSAPADPQLNWAYYDTAQKTAVIWDGTQWQMLARDGQDLSPAFVSMPFFSLVGGTFDDTKLVQILSMTEGATIYYSLDGSDPDPGLSSPYGAPILVDRTLTLKAIAVKAGLADSGIQTQTYAIVVPKPYLVPAGGTYASHQYVGVYNGTEGVSYRYTVDGTLPSAANGMDLTETVLVNSTLTLKVAGTKEGWTTSPVATAAYTIQTPAYAVAASPTFSFAPGSTFETELFLVIASSTPGATIFTSTDDGQNWVQGASLTLAATATVFAKTVKNGLADSATASATYTKVPSTDGRVVQPSVTISSGTNSFNNSTVVTMSTPTPGAAIWYTTNGNPPDASWDSSLLYTVPFTLTNAATITARAFIGSSGLAQDSLLSIQRFSLIEVDAMAIASVEGGLFTPAATGLVTTVESFSIGKYEVTWALWEGTYDWAQDHGYVIGSAGRSWSSIYGPATEMTLIAALVWCNALSERYGLVPVYFADAAKTQVLRDGSNASISVNIRQPSNGYRLPTPLEWEYAARNRGIRPGNQWAGDTNAWKVFRPRGIDLNWLGSLSETIYPATASDSDIYSNEFNWNSLYGKIAFYDGTSWVDINTLVNDGKNVAWSGLYDGLPDPLSVLGDNPHPYVFGYNAVIFDTVTNQAWILDSGLDRVAWTAENTPDGFAQVAGLKKPNELGIYDLSGNAGEMLLDASADPNLWIKDGTWQMGQTASGFAIGNGSGFSYGSGGSGNYGTSSPQFGFRFARSP